MPLGSDEFELAAGEAWLGLRAAEKAARLAYRLQLAEALSSATEVEVVLLDPQAKLEKRSLSIGGRQPLDRFPIMPYGGAAKIVNRKTLTPEEIQLLAPSLKATITVEETDEIFLCHDPVHGLRIYKGLGANRGRMVIFQANICYRCMNFGVAYPFGSPHWLNLSTPEFQKVMEQLMPIDGKTKNPAKSEER